MTPTKIEVTTFECTALERETMAYVRANRNFLDAEFGTYLYSGGRAPQKSFIWVGAKLEFDLIGLKAVLTFGDYEEWSKTKRVEVDFKDFKDGINYAILRDARLAVIAKREEEERLKFNQEVEAMANEMFGGLYRG